MPVVIDIVDEMKHRAVEMLKTSPEWKVHYLKLSLNYDTSALSQEVLDFAYEPVKPLLQPRLLVPFEYKNESSAVQSVTFRDSKTTTNSYQWSITKSIKTGISTSFHVGTPVLGGSVTVSIDLSLSTTDSQTKTETHTWDWQIPLSVPPHKRVVSEVSLQENISNPKFTARVRLNGAVHWKGWDVGGISGHITGRASPVDISGRVGQLFSFRPHSEVTVINDDSIEANVTGTFYGVEGSAIKVETKEYDINSGEMTDTNQFTLENMANSK